MNLEATRGFENSTLFQPAATQKTNDYELSRIKEVYDKKLFKANEDLAKKTSSIRTLELDLAKLREEN